MYNLKRMQYSTARAITQFNLGCMASEVEGLGEHGWMITRKVDAKRKLHMAKYEEKKDARKKKKQRKSEKEERKKREEGVTYEAGGGD